ncbi:MAG TPA: lysophospholipid acyltransferase family protein [Planctomycetota bacterium]|jgi:hypothetical protein|nr:lysophospholipid acyltransferase family protein [Planctomycetota bacterium]
MSAPEESTTPAGDATIPAARVPPRRLSFRRRVKHARRRFSRVVVYWLAPWLLRALARTWRMTVVGEENLARSVGEGHGRILALWHGRMLFGLSYHRSREWHALVSGSPDGAIFRALLARFGYRSIVGSTGRGGVGAVRQMLAVLEVGGAVIITPDGPRGPARTVAPSLAWLGRATGYPIVPIGFACDRAWYARSWDRFTIPRPWARVVMIYEDPVLVQRTADDADLVAATDRIRASIVRAETRGFEILQRDPDW